MGQREYVDFDLAIEDMGDGRYRARVLDSPSGQASIEFELPFSELELENFLLKIGRPRAAVRRLESPETEAARAFGERLYRAVFDGDVGTQWIRSIDAAEHDSQGLRLRLRLSEAPGLSELPWEYLYSPTNDDFVVLSSWTPMVRYISLDKGAPPLTIAPPLRMLAMVSSPSDYPPLDVEAEWARLEEGLAEIQEAGLIEIHRLEKATLRELQRALRRTDYHLFHFIGHGGFDAVAEDGILLLEDDAGRAREVSGRQLGTILDDARTIRLSVLNACEGARASGNDPFAGVAQSLVGRGIPAVVAMQFEITDRAAIIFAHEFYSAITDGMSVEAAVGEARRAIFGTKSDVEWGTAVLYMRAEDGRLFDLGTLPPPGEGPTLEMSGVEPTLELDPAGDGVADTEVLPVAGSSEAVPEVAGPEVAAASAVVADTDPVAAAIPEREAEDIVEPELEGDRASEPVTEPVPGPKPSFLSRNGRLVGVGASIAAVGLLLVALTGNGDGGTVTTEAPSTITEGTGGDLQLVDSAAITAVAVPDIAIDGDLSDWGELTVAYELRHPVANRLTSDRLGVDSTGILWVAYDDDALYVAVDVDDDVYSQPNQGNQIWRGDAVDINLVAAGDGEIPARPDPRTVQLTMTPLAEPASGPGVVVFLGNGEQFSTNTTDLAADVAGVVDADGSWRLEARIEWSVFQIDTPPPRLDAVLFALFDNDGEISDGRTVQAAILTNRVGVFFQEPRTWGTLTVE